MITTENAFTTVAPIQAAARAKVMATATPPAPATKVARKEVAKKVVKKSALVAKTPVKKAAKNAVNGPAKSVVKTVSKPGKEKKPKLVRDNFKIPRGEYRVLDELKQRAGKLASPVKRSALLRAGIKALAAMADSAFLAALKALPAIKTGRPAKG